MIDTLISTKSGQQSFSIHFNEWDTVKKLIKHLNKWM